MGMFNRKPRQDKASKPAEPVNPHPDRSCDRTCDPTDAAHDYGVVFTVERRS